MKVSPTYEELLKKVEYYEKKYENNDSFSDESLSNNIQEKKLNTYLNAFKDGVYLCSANKEIEYLNSAMIAKIGRNALGEKCYKAIYNLDEPCSYCYYDTLKEKGKTSVELKLNNKNYLVSSVLLENDSKITIYTDISKLKQTEADLRKNLIEFEEIQQIAKIGNWERNYINDKITWSNEMYNISEVDPKSFKPSIQNINQFIHPDYIEKHQNTLKKSLEGKQNYSIEFKLLLPNGKEKWVVQHGTRAYNNEGIAIRSYGNLQDITLQKNIELELIQLKEKAEENELYFRSIFDAQPSLISVTKVSDSTFTFVNKSFAKFTGYTKKELTGSNAQNINLIINANDITTINTELEKRRKVSNTEITITLKNGSLKTVDISMRFFKYMNELHILTTGQDITEQQKVKEEAKKLSVAVEQSASSIVITDVYGNIEYVNPKFTEVTGYTLKEVFGKNPRILSSGKQSNAYYEEMWKKIMAGEIWRGEFSNKIKNGNIIWEQVSITPIKNEKGEIVNFLADKEDITALKESEELLKSFINSVPDIICYKDGKGKWLLANNARLELFGLIDVDYFGKTDAELAHCTNVIYKELFSSCEISDEIAWRNKKTSKGIKIIPSINGEQKEYDFVKIPTFYNNGTRKALAIIGRDITELKKKEKELKLAKNKAVESDRLKTEFLNNMSHEIRTPLNGIIGFSEIITENTNISNEKRRNYGAIIKSSGNQLVKVIDDILEISRLGTKQVKAIQNKVNLNNVLLHLFSIFDIKAKENKVPLYLKKGLLDTESTIYTDESKLIKILSNLLENALKFTEAGSIELGYILNKTTNPPQLEIYVKDTGIGINKTNHKSIFDRFSQEEKEISQKTGGLGLGLSIAKENAEILGGTIQLKSKKGSGTTFTVIIPYKPIQSNTENINRPTTSETLKTSKPIILIAEDEEVNYIFLETLLHDSIKLNCTLIHAKNGIEAVEICKNNPAINLVLMDIKMPQLNGYQATKLIKKFRPNLPIVAQTAYSTQNDINTSKTMGCDDFISKPIRKKTLNAILTTYLKVKN
ncbi:MAG: PAS domain S-box protein [Lutibacter sp.]|uniref:PAS domain S-box protein n=1 Tax=Lutibacter sp. TaxID=1925666 RepID=UPI001848154A|nr:PAS domain S-box protein [Lutibacter sp.]MBT8316957.1 PAS domain S-box protein [Lutibacter sp.]NNJ57817.1 PAS domain S-box protein [Lutibacter sp.]